MTEPHSWQFASELWLWEGDAAWHFITVPEEISDEIEFVTSGNVKGFGSVRVEVTIGQTTWRTSVFPDTKRGAYVLPVKKQVRQQEAISVGVTANVRLALVL